MDMGVGSVRMGHHKELQKPVANVALAPSGSAYMALNGDVLSIIRENLKNQPLSLDLFNIVKSPSGGLRCFPFQDCPGRKRRRS